MTAPLDPFSEVLDERRRWVPDWYSWLVEVGRIVTAFTGTTVTTPAVPASTVTATNTTGKFLIVLITGGNVSAVTLNGVTASAPGAGGATLPMAPGDTIALTYAVAPTWFWKPVGI